MTDRTISATVIVSYYVVVLPSGVRSINESINISISKRHIDISIYRPITKLEPALTGAARLSEWGTAESVVQLACSTRCHRVVTDLSQCYVTTHQKVTATELRYVLIAERHPAAFTEKVSIGSTFYYKPIYLIVASQFCLLIFFVHSCLVIWVLLVFATRRFRLRWKVRGKFIGYRGGSRVRFVEISCEQKNVSLWTYHASVCRSSTTNAAVFTKTRTQFGKRAFSVCGPSGLTENDGHEIGGQDIDYNWPKYYNYVYLITPYMIHFDCSRIKRLWPGA